ncbi:phage minor head protein [Laceyella putida]|uniref:Phage minor head protein n=1 Tax=Laceyella putida TaxID=110101 RepID=A0ABW2RPK0_9BACL
MIKQAVLAPIDKLTLIDRLQRNRKRIIAEIKHQLAQEGLILGDSYEEMAQRMKKVLEQDANKSRTIARTEGHRVRNKGKVESTKKAAELGLNMVKVWDATLDKRTRPAHRRLDGTIVGVDEDFVSQFGGRGPAPGLMKTARDDINCPCIFRLQLVGEPQERLIRGEGVEEYLTYGEWEKKRGYKRF